MCVYCGDIGYVIDHVMPYSKGGPTVKGNLVLACYSCNMRKGGRVIIKYLVRGLYWLLCMGENLDWIQDSSIRDFSIYDGRDVKLDKAVEKVHKQIEEEHILTQKEKFDILWAWIYNNGERIKKSVVPSRLGHKNA